jgi:cysteine desulfurase
MIYLDHAATTPVLEASLRAAWPWLTTEFGNPSSTHELGLRAKVALDDARARTAKAIAARPSEVYFTSGATEANNLAIKGIALANPRGRHIVSAKTEHESVLESIEYLVAHQGFEVTWLPVDAYGIIAQTDLEAALRDDTTLVSLMWVNNETGTRHFIPSFANLCHERGIPMHVDAVQAATTEDVNMFDLRIAALSLSGHKLGAPKGSGMLFVRDGVPFEPQISGGGQEHGMRSGTENVAWAVAFATAIEITRYRSPEPFTLPDTRRFIERVIADVPGARLTGHEVQRSPLIASFVFEGVSGETVLLELERHGIVCSSGSACAAGRDEPSHVLTAMGFDEDLARTAVRFSFAKRFSNQKSTAEQSDYDLDRIVDVLREVVLTLRGRMNS